MANHDAPILEPEEKTEVLTGSENAIRKGVEFMQSTLTGMDLCYDRNGPSIVTRVDVYRDGYMFVKNRGCKIRVITEITKDNVSDCKELAKLVDELRHIDGVKGGLAVNDSQYMATVATLQEGKPLACVIYSNAKAMVEQQHYVFDSMWRHAVPAEARIREIEENTPIEVTRIISDNDEVIGMYKSLVEGAEQEILFLIPSARALLRIKAIGLIRSLIDVAGKRDVKIKILCPLNLDNPEVADQLVRWSKTRPSSVSSPSSSSSSSSATTTTSMSIGSKGRIPAHAGINGGGGSSSSRSSSSSTNDADDDTDSTQDSAIELRDNDGASAAILVVDRKHVLTSELRNDDTYDPYEALSLSSYSNSRPTVNSHIALFNSLWKQKEVYDELALREKIIERANEKLQAADKMKEEFINIAAHELRTPVLPIMLSAEELLEETLSGSRDGGSGGGGGGTAANDAYKRKVEIILRNAKRLVELTNDILDASRIESGTFKLHKDGRRIDEIMQLVEEAIRDVSEKMLEEEGDERGREIIFQNRSSSFTFASAEKQQLLFDRSKISQVMANLLGNAIKFTEKKDGKIIVSIDQVPSNTDDGGGDDDGSGGGSRNDNSVSSSPLSSSSSSSSSASLPPNLLLQIKISDNGIGIDASIKDKLFQKFVTKSERKTGSGLGLYICKAIIEAHGGRIWAEDNKDGLGATFTFTLPLATLKTTESQ